MSEKALQQSFMGMISAVITAVDVVSIAILIIILLILGNTIAMAVRERTTEYGVLRAIGFRGKHIAVFVLGEALTIGLIGGAIGLGLAHLFINLVLGPAIEENLGSILPHFQVPPELLAVGLTIAAALSIVAAAIPAYRASRLKVTDALRTLD
jgi:putative ABC transport system permease protein